MTIPLLLLTPSMNYATGGDSAGFAQALRIFKANLSTQKHTRNRARPPIDPKSRSSTAPLTCHQPREAAGRTMPKNQLASSSPVTKRHSCILSARNFSDP
jgi:hypothetical protein